MKDSYERETPLLMELDLQFFADEPADLGGGGYPSFEQFQSSLGSGEGGPEPTGDGEAFQAPIEEGNSGIGEQETPLTEAGLHRIKYMGEERELTYEELVKNAQMGFDYTQKMQRQHQEHNSRMEQVARMEAEYQDAIRMFNEINQDPGLAQYLSQAFEYYYQNPQAYPQAQPQQMDITQFPEFQQIQSQLQEITRQRETENVQRQWDELTSKYPDAKDIQVELIEKAIELDQSGFKGNALEIAYLMVNGGNLKQQAQKEVVEKSMAEQVAKTQIPGGGKSGGAPVTNEKPKTYEDIRRILSQQNKNFIE